MKEVEHLSGIKAYTIRTWEKRYAFLKPTRTLTNIRRYNIKEVKKILSIGLLNKYGIRISELIEMPENILEQKVSLLNLPNALNEKVILELIFKTLDENAEDFENILRQHTFLNTVEQTIPEVIVPFFERMEILWQTGNITPFQNYFINNIIRQKLYAALQDFPIAKGKDQKSICLFLPDKENRDLGLLCAAYLLNRKNLHVIYLGSNLPLNHVEYILKAMSPAFMFIHFTSAANIKFEKFLKEVSSRFKVPLIISGNLGIVFQKKIPSNITFKKGIHEVVTFAETL